MSDEKPIGRKKSYINCYLYKGKFNIQKIELIDIRQTLIKNKT